MMPTHLRTAKERWTQFLSFVAAWIAAAAIGSALLFYFTADSDRPGETAPAVPASIDVDERAPEPPAATRSEPTIEAPPPEPAPDPVAKPTRSNRRAAPRPAAPHVMSGRERAAKVGAHIRSATRATEAGDYDGAIRDYDSALELDPNNFEVKILKDQVESLRELEARNPERRFHESPTEITAGGAPTGATAAELIIELLPAAPNPGDPYVLRVRAHNFSDELMALTSVELTDTHESMKHERGRATKPLAQRLGPKENALLWEKKSDWTVADRNGSIVVAVTLADGSRLSKSLSW